MAADDAQVEPIVRILSVGESTSAIEASSPEPPMIETLREFRDVASVLEVDDQIVFSIPAKLTSLPTNAAHRRGDGLKQWRIARGRHPGDFARQQTQERRRTNDISSRAKF